MNSTQHIKNLINKHAMSTHQYKNHIDKFISSHLSEILINNFYTMKIQQNINKKINEDNNIDSKKILPLYNNVHNVSYLDNMCMHKIDVKEYFDFRQKYISLYQQSFNKYLNPLIDYTRINMFPVIQSINDNISKNMLCDCLDMEEIEMNMDDDCKLTKKFINSLSTDDEIDKSIISMISKKYIFEDMFSIHKNVLEENITSFYKDNYNLYAYIDIWRPDVADEKNIMTYFFGSKSKSKPKPLNVRYKIKLLKL